MTIQITPAELANEIRETAVQAKVASKDLSRALGSLHHACGQLVTHQSAAAEKWYQQCYANAVKANREYQELISRIIQ